MEIEQDGDSIEAFACSHRQRLLEAQMLDDECDDMPQELNLLCEEETFCSDNATLDDMSRAILSIDEWKQSREARLSQLMSEYEATAQEESECCPETEENFEHEMLKFETSQKRLVPDNSSALEKLLVCLSDTSAEETIAPELKELLLRYHQREAAESHRINHHQSVSPSRRSTQSPEYIGGNSFDDSPFYFNRSVSDQRPAGADAELKLNLADLEQRARQEARASNVIQEKEEEVLLSSRGVQEEMCELQDQLRQFEQNLDKLLIKSV